MNGTHVLDDGCIFLLQHCNVLGIFFLTGFEVKNLLIGEFIGGCLHLAVVRQAVVQLIGACCNLVQMCEKIGAELRCGLKHDFFEVSVEICKQLFLGVGEGV